MCVIIDANAISEIFRSDSGRRDTRPEAGKEFFNWLDLNPESLVIGGSKLRKELNIASFKAWAQEIERSGKLKKYDNEEIDQREKELRDKNSCKSDDEHIIALAQISNARLLYSKDEDLHKDFKEKELIDQPRGQVYSTLKNPNFDSDKKDLLHSNLCKLG